MEKTYQITDLCHRMVSGHIQKGGLCVDATMGNGNDTEFLCRAVGEAGRVLAFDIQQAALDQTRRRLRQNLEYQNYELYLESHERMADYVAKNSVDCILFNLGYLPGGDHRLATRAESTLKALDTGLLLLKKNGVMGICIYSGGDSGFEERDAVLGWLKALDHKKYLALVTEYYNRPNHPPIPVTIIRL